MGQDNRSAETFLSELPRPVRHSGPSKKSGNSGNKGIDVVTYMLYSDSYRNTNIADSSRENSDNRSSAISPPGRLRGPGPGAGPPRAGRDPMRRRWRWGPGPAGGARCAKISRSRKVIGWVGGVPRQNGGGFDPMTPASGSRRCCSAAGPADGGDSCNGFGARRRSSDEAPRAAGLRVHGGCQSSTASRAAYMPTYSQALGLSLDIVYGLIKSA